MQPQREPVVAGMLPDLAAGASAGAWARWHCVRKKGSCAGHPPDVCCATVQSASL